MKNIAKLFIGAMLVFGTIGYSQIIPDIGADSFCFFWLDKFPNPADMLEKALEMTEHLSDSEKDVYRRKIAVCYQTNGFPRTYYKVSEKRFFHKP